MKQKVIIAIIILILVVGASIVFIKKESFFSGINNNKSNNTDELLEEIIQAPVEQANLSKKDKVDNLKKKITLKGLIRKGDQNIAEKDYALALSKYLQVYKEVPTDQETIQKIGEIYFHMKKYKQSYRYFSRILGYKKLNIDLALRSLLFHQEITEENIDYFYTELSKFPISKEQSFYYKNSLSCTQDLKNCKTIFRDYFQAKQEESEEIENFSGSILEYDKLQYVNNAFINYTNFQNESEIYEDALLAGAYFQSGDYPIAISIGKNILTRADDYLPIIKMLAKSYFELGDTQTAKKYINSYSQINDKDPDMIYFNGVVQEKLKEYTLSILHFQNALKIGAKNSLEIRKRLLFNYYEIDNEVQILKTFDEMIEHNSEEMSIKDYQLLIFYNIQGDNDEKTNEYIKIAQNIYPDENLFQLYQAWIYLKQTDISGSIEKAREIIEPIYTQNTKDALSLYLKGMIDFESGEYKKSFIYFKKASVHDKSGEIGDLAKEQLEKIEVAEKRQEINTNKIKDVIGK